MDEHIESPARGADVPGMLPHQVFYDFNVKSCHLTTILEAIRERAERIANADHGSDVGLERFRDLIEIALTLSDEEFAIIAEHQQARELALEAAAKGGDRG